MTILQPTRQVSQIKRGDRRHNDYGNIDAFAKSIAEKGLLPPIAITSDDLIHSGERLLLAW